jgi:hypothetical protein
MSKNPRNESGKEFEGIVRDILKEHEIRTNGPQSTGIDFPLLDFGIGLDAKGQSGDGTDFEGWPLKVYKHLKDHKRVVIVNRLPHRHLTRASYLDMKEMVYKMGGEIVHIDDFHNWCLELKDKEPEPFF